MKVSARVQNSFGTHATSLTTNDNTHSVVIPPRASGFGSSASGGELLFLALATCYCNDIYREAGKRGITVEHVEVVVEGQFGAEGEPASQILYHAKVIADATADEIQELMRDTDTLAEVQNTLRVQTPITLGNIEAVSARS